MPLIVAGFWATESRDMFCLESEDRAWEEKQSLVEQKSPLSQGPCLDCARDIRPKVNMRVMKQNRMSNDGNDLFGCEGSVIR